MSADDSSGSDDGSRTGPFRFPGEARLTTGADFSRVFSRPLRSADPYFTVLARRRDGGTARLGMAVSRRTAKSAVVRNRIKRLIRESFRHGCDQLPSTDIVVISRPPAAEASNKTLTRSLETHWRRLRGRRSGEG